MIAAVVLAAGRATRFGGTKVLATLQGTPLVRHVVDRVAQAGVERIVVTAGDDAASLRAVLAGTIAEVVGVPDAAAGLSASLRGGVEALAGDVSAFVVALGDQPLVDPQLVTRLCEVWAATNAAAVVPVYRDGQRGNPVLFDATMRPRLRALAGDVGARDLLRAMGDRVLEVRVDADAPRDVDTRADLDALEG